MQLDSNINTRNFMSSLVQHIQHVYEVTLEFDICKLTSDLESVLISVKSEQYFSMKNKMYLSDIYEKLSKFGVRCNAEMLVVLLTLCVMYNLNLEEVRIMKNLMSLRVDCLRLKECLISDVVFKK